MFASTVVILAQPPAHREQYEQWLNQALDRLLVTRSRSR